MKKIALGVSFALALTAAGFLHAQPNSESRQQNGTYYDRGGYGGHMGNGYGRHGGGGRGGWCGNGGGGHMGGYMMNGPEMDTFRDQIFASKNYNECKKIQDKQYSENVKRAKAQNVTLPSNPPRAGMCENLSDRGYFDRK